MSAQPQIKLTEAENALLIAYTEQVGDLPGNGDVLVARDRLITDIKTRGLPTRRVEAWHYTDLRNLLRQVPDHANGDVKALEPLIAGSAVLALENGKVVRKAKAEGVSVRGIAAMLEDGTGAFLMSPRGDDDAVGRINGGFLRDGLEIAVADGAALAEPIELQVLHSGGQSHGRFVVSVGAGASARIVERQQGNGAAQALVSSVSDLTLKAGADVTWVIVQEQGVSDTHLGQMNFRLEKDAKLRLFIVNAGGKLVRQEVHGVTVGEGSDFTFRVVNLLGGESHTDVTMTLGHDVPDTTSTEIVRNVVFDKASGVFQGQIRVAPDAQKTDARMACNTLLLSEEADFSTKPELEIFADDVQCAHGATVADIDRNHLYYLMARGIPEKKARALLVQAFVAEVVEELDDEPLVEALEDVIEGWLERHGN
ncbi:Fe-S cluster assembly protein SufD [Rhizobium sp. C1]|uniref:Fe-S cluster assembly protein SufD n=1 Tax=Rhizobium sp. C1 TaxID=1349799 RepID=UPI001E643387|nr:Fe-S cluster assembly protein SufD [Rhizobium sp. C1]MCD2176895.1 Fe-S cluster assembly protein SufD [Rhizobium sp. C1]